MLEISTSASSSHEQGETKSSPGRHSIRHAVLQSARLSSFAFEQFARFVYGTFFPPSLLGFQQLILASNFDQLRSSSSDSLGFSNLTEAHRLVQASENGSVPLASRPHRQHWLQIRPSSAIPLSAPSTPRSSSDRLQLNHYLVGAFASIQANAKCHPNTFLERTLTHEAQKEKGYQPTSTKSTVDLERIKPNKFFLILSSIQ